MQRLKEIINYIDKCKSGARSFNSLSTIVEKELGGSVNLVLLFMNYHQNVGKSGHKDYFYSTDNQELIHIHKRLIFLLKFYFKKEDKIISEFIEVLELFKPIEKVHEGDNGKISYNFFNDGISIEELDDKYFKMNGKVIQHITDIYGNLAVLPYEQNKKNFLKALTE